MSASPPVSADDWLIRQLEAWPTRIDPEKTTNIEYLMKQAAATLADRDATIERLSGAIREHDRFNREDLGYTGPDDPALDPACGEDWQRMLAALAALEANATDHEETDHV